ncbi:THO complex subunit [Fasciolopsis buskii]|uniref:THO complex subunit n=1 Tax=Fasciolopsis buskii TaxID=27845 RepID=A0A8E0S413_9TREM|nr:THO complex subunit [Fasciolopsis buski]
MEPTDLKRIRSHFSRHSRVKEFPGYGGKIHTLAWNVTGCKLASGSSDKLVNVYALDGTRLSKTQTFRGHNESVDQLCWHPTDPDVLASVGADGAVRLWDCRSKKDPVTAQLKGENINLAWMSDGRCIAVGSKTDLISWLDVRAGLKLIQSEQFNFEINEFAWKPNSDIFLLTTGLGSILVYSGKPGDMKRETSLFAHPVNAMCLQFSPNGKYFAVGSADALVSIWDADEFVCLRTQSRLEWPVRTLGFSFDSQVIAAASEDHFIDIGHVETSEQVFQIGTHAAATFVLSWHPKQYLLSYSSEAKYDQGVIRLFGLSSDGSRPADSI